MVGLEGRPKLFSLTVERGKTADEGWSKQWGRGTAGRKSHVGFTEGVASTRSAGFTDSSAPRFVGLRG